MNQTTHDAFTEYTGVIENLTAVAANIARVEEVKTTAATERRHELLDGCIQEEQAYLLKLRGLEQHRTKLQEVLGWNSFTLRQILEVASPEQEEILAPLFGKLEQQLNRLQQSREAAEQIIHIRLHELETLTQRGMSYDNGGNVSSNDASQPRIRNKYV